MKSHLTRIIWALGTTAAVVVSLMTFPSAIPWMVAFWLGWHTWRVRRGGQGYLPLAVCLGILAVKGVAWIPELAITMIRKLVLWSPLAPPGMWTFGPHLSDDGLHPNAHGNRLLADEVAGALVRLYGERIRQRR